MRHLFKLYFILLPTLLPATITLGQKQEGYVKTLGRPETRGVALRDVIIKIKGEHNPVKSNDEGVFTIQFQNKKNGDAYTLQEVRKVGYELNEPEVIGRQFAVSDKVKTTIVMVSSAQFHADKQRIENNAYKVAEKNYKHKLALLEKEKEDGTITVEKYREQLQELQNRFEKYQSLIDGLAEHYAHTDYDDLNDKEREINICIENGDLERADSLIQLLFDPIDVLKRNQEALAKLNLQILQAEGVIDQAKADMASVLAQQEKDAEHLYQLYTIALARFDNEKARFYIEARAELDSTNVKWQIDAAEYLRDFFNDFHQSSFYCRRALDYAHSQYGETNEWVAEIYNEMGLNDGLQSNYSTAIELFLKSVHINRTIPEGNTNKLADYYNNLGYVYNSIAEYGKAKDYMEEALSLMNNENREKVISIYNNIGNVLFNQGEYNKSMIYLEKALQMQLSLFGDNNPHAGDYFNNLGMLFQKMGQYEKAQTHLESSLTIYKKTYGDNHIAVANTLNNIGLICSDRGQYELAERDFRQALEVVMTIMGETNSFVGCIYHNLGSLYYNMGDDESSADYLMKCLEIRQKIYPATHPEMASIYNSIANVCCRTNELDLALELYKKTLEIRKELYKDENDLIARSYNNIGYAYELKGMTSKALDYYMKALTIRKRIFRENHQDVATSYNNIGGIYMAIKDYSKALDYLEKALRIRITLFGETHPGVGTCYNNIGYVLSQMNKPNEALKYYNKAHSILINFWKEDHPNMITLKSNIKELEKYK